MGWGYPCILAIHQVQCLILLRDIMIFAWILVSWWKNVVPYQIFRLFMIRTLRCSRITIILLAQRFMLIIPLKILRCLWTLLHSLQIVLGTIQRTIPRILSRRMTAFCHRIPRIRIIVPCLLLVST